MVIKRQIARIIIRQSETVRKFGHIPTKAKELECYHKYCQKVNGILANGLDIGTIMKCLVPVSVVLSKEYGLCFSNPKYGLYPVISRLY